MSKRVLCVMVAALTLVLGFVAPQASAFTLTGTQEANGTTTLNGTGGETLAPSGGVYYWSASPSANLVMTGTDYLYTDGNSEHIKLDLLKDATKGTITGAHTLALSTTYAVAGGEHAGDVVITNAGDISMGGIDTHVTTVGSTAVYPGNVYLGTAANPVGNVRVDYIHAQADGSWSQRGDHARVEIYSTGDVLVQNQDGSTRGDILTYHKSYGATYYTVRVEHNGDFRAGTINTFGQRGSCAPNHVVLDGGGGGTCDVVAIKTMGGDPNSDYGCGSGNVTIQNYTAVDLVNIETWTWRSSELAGDVSILNIAGDVNITGTINLNSGTNNDGDLTIVTTGSKITLASLDLDLVGTASFTASDDTWVTGDLNNFAVGDPLNAGLETSTFVWYDPSVTANSYLLGDAYDLTGGGKLVPLGWEPPLVPEPAGLGLLGLALLGLRKRRS